MDVHRWTGLWPAALEEMTLNFCVSIPRDAADLVVQGKGKLEELMVCSREIAASTAQLVAASKVRPVPWTQHVFMHCAWLAAKRLDQGHGS